MTKIAIGADHGGFALKEAIKKHLEKSNLEVVDFGTNSDASVDYPDFGHAVANFVIKEKAIGIAICGSGIGISITANRHKGIRCGLIREVDEVILSRLHNNINMIALGGRFTPVDKALKIVDAFIKSEYEGGRHNKRIEKIEDFSNENKC